jgi:prepilin signal peptidase PulO-like enzyme (type II secretory pathway)
VNLLLAIPLPVRLGALFVLGACLGSLLNLGIYRLAWHQRLFSPWSPAPPKAAPRTWADRIPLFGWFRLQREVEQFGRGFWIRPLLIEFSFGVGLACLYVWEVVEQGLYGFPGMPQPIPIGMVEIPASILHWQFFSHLILLSLMVVATFIDIDEKTIPDAITISGTLVGLTLATLVPHSLPGQLFHWPVARTLGTKLEVSEAVEQRMGADNSLFHEVVNPASPLPFPPQFDSKPNLQGLAIGLGCYWLWCFAYAPRPWYARHGLRRAFRIATARLCRSLKHPVMLGLIGIGTAAILGVWFWTTTHWVGLLTALIGMAASGSIVWMVRIIGAVTLRKEAMGFGDVLLMMMIGSFIGWQGGMIVFFLAPGAGLLIGILQLIFRRDQYIPYGPFLCLATLAVIVYWAPIWDYSRLLFDLGLILPGILLGCMAAMTVMLAIWRAMKEAFLARIA